MPAAAAERVGSVGARGRCAWEGAAARAWSEKEEEERETRDAGAECTARAAHELRLAQRRRAAQRAAEQVEDRHLVRRERRREAREEGGGREVEI